MDIIILNPKNFTQGSLSVFKNDLSKIEYLHSNLLYIKYAITNFVLKIVIDNIFIRKTL